MVYLWILTTACAPASLDTMKAPARFELDLVARNLADHLCAEFDPEQFIPDWTRESLETKEWDALLRVERHELRGRVEVAVNFRPRHGLRGAARLDIALGTFLNRGPSYCPVMKHRRNYRQDPEFKIKPSPVLVLLANRAFDDPEVAHLEDLCRGR
jgi:hypothetical protein